ncbi:MAG: hypothetical protein K0S44_1984 [Bacteroidetes bacterium]|jgi:hypothetical protein|nr:hypothetical protein [Bacteroidota bacterium]
MKNIIIAAALIFAGTSFTSCKKDYTCKCSKTYTSGTGSSTQDYSVYTYRETRDRAETRCNENTTTGYDLGGDYSINCQIQ